MKISAEETMKPEVGINTKDHFDMMRFYDESAARAKERIWTITSWILALNAGIIGYSVKFYLDHRSEWFLLLGLIFCAVGIALCRFAWLLIVDH